MHHYSNFLEVVCYTKIIFYIHRNKKSEVDTEVGWTHFNTKLNIK